MASTRAMIERRRSSRVSICIPVKLSGNETQGERMDTHAEAIAVSRCGALIRAPFSPALGSRVEVLNGHSQETSEFRVVRVTDAKEPRVLPPGPGDPLSCAELLGCPVS